MLRVVHIRNKKLSNKYGILLTWSNRFCCYVIKSAGETAKKVSLSIIWNLTLIEIHLSQIRISDSKREKVCAVCPYHLFTLHLTQLVSVFCLSFNSGHKNKRHVHTAHTFLCLMSNVLIWERLISISSGFQTINLIT